MAILPILHVVKSITYKHQIHRFRVFRQSQQLSVIEAHLRSVGEIAAIKIADFRNSNFRNNAYELSELSQ